jgi:hypothetical protein
MAVRGTSSIARPRQEGAFQWGKGARFLPKDAMQGRGDSTPRELRRARSRTHVLLLRHALWMRHTPRAASRFVGQPFEPGL